MDNDIIVYIKTDRVTGDYTFDIIYPDGSSEFILVTEYELRQQKKTLYDMAEDLAMDTYESKYGASQVSLSIF